MGRPVIILLALSLAANVFLGGFVAGRIASPTIAGIGESAGHRNRSEEHRRDLEALPPAVREKLRSAFRNNREEFVKSFREGRALHQEFIGILTADVFDRASAEAAAAKIEAFDGKRRQSMPRLVIDAMEGLSVEDRRALAAVVERRMMEDAGGPGRRHHRRRSHGKDDAPEPPPAATDDLPKE